MTEKAGYSPQHQDAGGIPEADARYLSQIARRMGELYVSYRKRFVLSLPGQRMFVPQKKDGNSVPLTDASLWKHVHGDYSVAVYAGRSTSRFMCFDVDVSAPAVVRSVIEGVEHLGVRRDDIHVSRSGLKGYHVELFFDRQISTEQLLRFYRAVLAFTGESSRRIEFRPSFGQAVKLPLSRHAVTGAICWYVDRETLMPIEDMSYILSIQPISAQRFHEIAEALPADSTARENKSLYVPDCFIEQPEVGAPLTRAGTRHEAMVRMAVASRGSGDNADVCRTQLTDWYRRQDQSLIRSSEAEVLEDVERILKWAYSDRFTSRGAQYGILTEADIALVLSRKRRSERRTLFLLLARSAAGRRRIKQNTIAARIGMSRVSVIHAIQRLSEAGIVFVKRGETKYRGKGNFASQCNSYDVVRKRPEHGMRCKSISLERLNRAFDEVYNETIQELQQRERRNQR